MLPPLPTPNAAVLKRLQTTPLAYWQHVGDPLPDLLGTLFAHDNSLALLTVVQHEAEQGHGLCQQFLETAPTATAWVDPRYSDAIRAWQNVCADNPLLIRLAWLAGITPVLLAQPRWNGFWFDDPSGFIELITQLDELLRSSSLPTAQQLQQLRLLLAILRRDGQVCITQNPPNGCGLAQADLATLIVLISEDLPRCLHSLGLVLSANAQQGLRYWLWGLGQALQLEPALLAKNADESLAFRHLLIQPANSGAANKVHAWLRILAQADPLPAAERRVFALTRSLISQQDAISLRLPGDALGGLWRKANRWVVETSRPITPRAATAGLQRKTLSLWR
ncbi:MAG: hypothetical protein Q8L72_10735 [Moraxellaceae bacterium]|nr:hypothetical protein [Moraxellaceae bacterium]